MTVDRRSAEAAGRPAPVIPPDDGYKWVALTNTTAGVLLATIDGSILIIAMPDIFRGIHLDPLVPGNSVYLLWLILGYLVTGSVLVVSVATPFTSVLVPMAWPLPVNRIVPPNTWFCTEIGRAHV